MLTRRDFHSITGSRGVTCVVKRKYWRDMGRTASLSKIDHPDSVVRARPSSDSGSAIDILSLFWRRKMLLIGTVILVTGFCVLVAYQITPRYTASARLMVGKEDVLPSGLSGINRVLRGDLRAHIYGEIEVMRSDRLIQRVIEELALMRHAEFNRVLRKSAFAWLFDLAPVRRFMETIDAIGDEGLSDTEKRTRENQEIVNAVRKRLMIRPPGVSNVISVNFESTNAKKAARIVNAFTKHYISDHLDRKFRSQAQSRAWLDKRITTLRRAVLDSERTVAEFLASRRLIETGENVVNARQFVDVSRQVTAAKALYAERRTRLNQVHRLRDSEQGLSAVKEVRASPSVQRLRDQEIVLVRKAAELETRFGERHPKMINLRAEIANVRQRIADEEIRIVQELENEVRVTKSRLDALSKELDKLDELRTAAGGDRARLRQLQREAQANQRLYETYLLRLKQSDAPLGRQQSSVEVISPAQAPLNPSYPRKHLIIGFGILISFALGTFLVFVLERLDNGFRTAAQVEQLTDNSVLGVVPRLAQAEKEPRVTAELVVDDPTSNYVETIRSLRTSLMVSDVDDPPKVVLMASALPGEGKTSLAVALARQSAISSLAGKVMLIDCDLRRPSVSGMMQLRADKGIADLFAGEATFEEVVRTDPKTGLHVLPAIPGTPNPPELLNSQHMRGLLDKLVQTYELVILDSPALESVSDARVLAHLADATVFVVQWEATPRQTALGSLKQLISAGGQIAGVVLHKVNLRKHAKYYKYGYEDAPAG